MTPSGDSAVKIRASTLILSVVVVALLAVVYLQWHHIDSLRVGLEKEQQRSAALQREIAIAVGGGP